MGGLMLAIIGICFIGLIAVGVMAYYAATAETFELRKDSWECVAQHVEHSTTMMLVGNVPIFSSTSTKVCDSWKRK